MPYVLRHLASLLSAGVGIAEAMLSVANSDYGVISEEFELIVRDMRSGASFEEALTRFEERMASENVSRVVKQILRAVKFGGELSGILYKLAEDFSFEYRMKLMEYVQKINGLAFVYMFISVVMPTMLVVAILAASIMAKTLVMSVQGLAVLLLFGFPAMAFLMVVMIKCSEPRVIDMSEHKIESLLIGIIEKILPERVLKKYDLFLYSAGISFKASEYLLTSFLVAIIAGTILFMFNTFYGVIGFVVILAGMVFGYTYWRITKRIDEMEEMLPDAFFIWQVLLRRVSPSQRL